MLSIGTNGEAGHSTSRGQVRPDVPLREGVGQSTPNTSNVARADVIILSAEAQHHLSGESRPAVSGKSEASTAHRARALIAKDSNLVNQPFGQLVSLVAKGIVAVGGTASKVDNGLEGGVGAQAEVIGDAIDDAPKADGLAGVASFGEGDHADSADSDEFGAKNRQDHAENVVIPALVAHTELVGELLVVKDE